MATKNNTKNTLSAEDDLNSKIKGMFYILQTSTEKFLEELDRSYELYKIGEKTEITSRLEQIATEYVPGTMEAELITKLLNTLNTLGKRVVIEGFIQKLDDIQAAFILSENDKRILYGVVPKKGKDSEIRKEISAFYAETSHWQMFRYTEPLIQVIPNHLKNKINYQSTIL